MYFFIYLFVVIVLVAKQLVHSLASTVTGSWFVVVGQFDLVWEVIVEFDFGFLSECLTGNGLESVLDIDAFFCTCFEIRDVILAVAPLLRSFR